MESYKLDVERDQKQVVLEGTIDKLIEYFAFTLEIANAYDEEIDRNPTTFRDFLYNVSRALDIKECAAKSRTRINLTQD